MAYNLFLNEYRVKVLRRIFFSETSGFGVFAAHFPKENDRLVIAGMLAGVAEGDRLDIQGEEVVHPRFGRQVKVHSFSHHIPSDMDGLAIFLGSGRFKGVGPKTARKLVDSFAEELPAVLEKDPERLFEVKGVNRKVVQALADAYRELKDQRELMIRLAPYSVGQETIYRILAAYGHQVMAVLDSNPYRLMSEVKGIGFKIADTIARAMGFEKDHPLRVQSALLWLVEQLEQRQGDLVFPVFDLLMKARRQFDMPEELLLEQLKILVGRRTLIQVDRPVEGVCRPESYWAEKTIADKLMAMQGNRAELSPGASPIDEENSCVETLTELQLQALSLAFTVPVQIITGGPGTGKTTVIKEIVRRCQDLDLGVAVAAPTGRAAKRIEESSGYPASTIHRLLKIDPENGTFVHQEHNPLEYDMVVIDEFSMVDAFLFAALLKALEDRTHLVLLGDKDQLPSVGPGNVIRDVIGSGLFPVTVLNHNFRQENAATLISLADTIQAGRADLFLEACSREQEQFCFIHADTESLARKLVLEEMERIMERLPISSLDYQVLSPMYRGEAGVEQLNQQIQERFNPREMLVEMPGRQFRLGDRVMQLRNNYQLEIFNGEQGVVCGYDASRRMLKVDFGERTLELSREQLDDIILSYASTVHKAQGAEFQEIVLCMLPVHGIMLNRELFYTALTRARKRVVLVGSPQAVRQAIQQTMPRFRKTLLLQRLRDAQQGFSDSF